MSNQSDYRYPRKAHFCQMYQLYQRVNPSLPIRILFQQSVDAASIEKIYLVSCLINYFMFYMSLTLHYQKALGTATDITFEYILSLANL
jgi:hypothetical protein